MNPLLVQGAAQLLLGKYKTNKGMLMKNMLTMGVVGLVIFAGMGWYLDWYRVSRTTGADGKSHYSVDFNKQRIEADLQRGRDQVKGYLGSSPGVPPLQAPAYPPPGQTPYPYVPAPGGVPQQPAYPQGYAPPAPTNWAPTAPTSRPGGFFPQQQPAFQQPAFQQPAFQQPGFQQPPAFQPQPGRPF